MRRISWAFALIGVLPVQVATATTPPMPAEFARYAEPLLAKARAS